MIGRTGIAVRAQYAAHIEHVSSARRAQLSVGQHQRVVHQWRAVSPAAIWAGSLVAASALLLALAALQPPSPAAPLPLTATALLSGSGRLALALGLVLLAVAAAGPHRALLATVIGGIAALPSLAIGVLALLSIPAPSGVGWAVAELVALVPLIGLCARASLLWTLGAALIAVDTALGSAAIVVGLALAAPALPGAPWAAVSAAAVTALAAIAIWTGRRRAS